MRVFTAHDPSTGPAGTDLLIVLHDDGTGEFSTRPGLDQRWTTWSAPVPLRAEVGE